jgi:uncharacterized protein
MPHIDLAAASEHELSARGPVPSVERFEVLDVVRGLALFGIVSANMISYSLYLYLPQSAKTAMSTHAADRVLDFLELCLIEGKFYTIFSVLFGIGFSVLLSRAATKQLSFRQFYLRRVTILFAIGFAHAVLFWHNDILEAYALCGALLLPLVTARDRTVLTLACLALLAPIAIKLAGGIPVSVLSDIQNTLYDRFGFTRDTRVETWTRGGSVEIVKLNLTQVLSQASFLLSSGMVFRIYGCFLLGFYIGRHEMFKKLAAARPALRAVTAAGLTLGLPLNAVYAASFDSGSWVEILSGTFGILPLSAGYVALCCLTWLAPRGPERLRHFAPVGRMALTNYVGQSVIGTLIFRGNGLGLGGTMGPTLYLPLGVAVYAVQVVASRWWLGRFQFGPLEWLWRMLTYGERLKISRRPAIDVAS